MMTKEALLGAHTRLGLANFPAISRPLSAEPDFVRAYLLVKQAAALANAELGALDTRICHSICRAVDQALAGELDHLLLVDMMEGSGGTSTNMCLNEAIASAANRALGDNGATVLPIEHVNRSQSTNDTYPTALRLSLLVLGRKAVEVLLSLAESFEDKGKSHSGTLRLGRTCLQDAQPMSLGQAFGGYGASIRAAADAISRSFPALHQVPLGSTAVGTGMGAPVGFRERAVSHLSHLSGLKLVSAPNGFSSLSSSLDFASFSAELRNAGSVITKIASDIVLLSSGPVGGLGELRLKAVQPGSSAMPGKANPVQPLSIMQAGFALAGNDLTVSMAVQAGQLEINSFDPLIATHLLDSLRIFNLSVPNLTACVGTMEIDEHRARENLRLSPASASLLLERIGYAAAQEIVGASLSRSCSAWDIAVERGLVEAGPDPSLDLATLKRLWTYDIA